MDLTTDFSGLFTPQSDELTFEALMDRVQELEERVAMQSIDCLTGVLSTDEFYAAVQRILKDYPNEKFVMWRFDIDKFQTVNNLFGVEEGNRLLVYCAKHLKSYNQNTRANAIGRIGGDVFCGISPFHDNTMTYGDGGNHWLTAASTLASMEGFFKGFRDDFRFTVSIGFYQIEDPTDPIEILYSRTLAASKACKNNSEQIYAFYDKTLSHAIEEKQLITAEMHNALENGEFTVFLQPKVRLSDLSLVGAEALVRWIHPKKGRIPPDSFIPIFEENGFITKLDLYVLRRCCAYIQSWMRQGLNLIPLSVNLSQMDLSTPGLPFKIQGVLGEYKVAAKYIHLEITESAYADDVEQVNGVTQAFKDLGFHLEMDDFGKGYSSLNMIAELPIDTLKLDMGFLQGDQEGSGKVISFVTGLARHMELTTVAEGIETQEQLAFLRSINCDCGQGYLFSKPLPKADFDAYMRGCEIGTMVHKVKGVDRSIAEYRGWNTAEIWKPDSPFSKMFNAFAGGVGICELGMLQEEFRLTRYNPELAKELGSSLEVLKHHSDNLLTFVHPEDLPKIRECINKVSDPKDWARDHGLCELELRMQVLETEHDVPGGHSGQQCQYNWMRIRWRLVEFSTETRTYVVLMNNTNHFHQELERMEARLEQVDDLERQMSIFSQAGLAGTATLRFVQGEEAEVIYANRHFLYLHSQEEEFGEEDFPLLLSEILPPSAVKPILDKFKELFAQGVKTFEWSNARHDKKGVHRNIITNGRIRSEGKVSYAEVVISSLSDASTLEVELNRKAKQSEEILSSADMTVIDFKEGGIYYGTDLQLAYGLPSRTPFDPAMGFPDAHLFHPDSLALFEKTVADLLQNGGVRTIDLWMRHNDYVDYALRQATFFAHMDSSSGRVHVVRGLSREITKERYGTENVSVGEIITHIPDGLLVFSTATGKLLYANEVFYQIVGVNQEKLEKDFKNYPLLLISDEGNPETALPEIAVEGRSFIREAQLKNHALRWVEFLGVRQGPYVYGTVRDITPRKELEILLDRETNFNEILNNITDELLFRVDLQEKTVRFTGKSARDFGLPAKQIPFHQEAIHSRGIICEEYEESYFQMVQDMFKGIEKTYDVQLRALNGGVSWYRFEYRIVQESGEPAFAVGKALNIDYQVELLEQLERDVMTGFYNASAMKLRSNQVLNATATHGEKVENPEEHALLVITIANYGEISSNMNLNQRDETIIRLAEVIKNNFRDSDLVGRISEEVFAIFMKGVSVHTMPLQKASALYLDFKHFNTMSREGHKLDLKISCSYASKDGSNYPTLLENAKLIPVDVEIY